MPEAQSHTKFVTLPSLFSKRRPAKKMSDGKTNRLGFASDQVPEVGEVIGLAVD
jgi:hypothetical protein